MYRTYTGLPLLSRYIGAVCKVNAKYSVSSDLYGDITGRLGYAVGPTLFYAKGGFAFLDAA